jgi:hypothetical protein
MLLRILLSVAWISGAAAQQEDSSAFQNCTDADLKWFTVRAQMPGATILEMTNNFITIVARMNALTT